VAFPGKPDQRTDEALLGPFVAVSQDQISFHVNGPPGTYDADAPIDVLVRGIVGYWMVSCHAEPLLGDQGEIPPSRLFLQQEVRGGDIDDGAGQGFATLAESRLVAEGGFTGPEMIKVNTLRLRLLTTWSDKPGIYTGVIKFTYLMKP
jgi:hypothetical protein